MADSERHWQRLAQGNAAVFSVSAAAALLPMKDLRAMVWLQESGLVKDLCGKPVVIWGDVVSALKKEGR